MLKKIKKITNFGTFSSTSSSSDGLSSIDHQSLSSSTAAAAAITLNHCDDQLTITPIETSTSLSSSSSSSSIEETSSIMNVEYYQSKKAKFYVIAIHNYCPVNNDTDLPLIKGEQYEILDSSGVWWLARDINKQIGLVPHNYLEIVTKPLTAVTSTKGMKKFTSKDDSLINCNVNHHHHHHSQIDHNIDKNNNINISKSKSTSSSILFDIEMLSLFQQLWFFSIDRETAEHLLQQSCNPDGCFLVRPSSTENKCLTLSVLIKNDNHKKTDRRSEVKHYLIQREKSSRLLDTTESSLSSTSSSSLASLSSCSSSIINNENQTVYFIRPQEKFTSVESLIEYYRKNRGHLITRLSTAPCRANFIWQKSSMIVQQQQAINSMIGKNSMILPSSMNSNHISHNHNENNNKNHNHKQSKQQQQQKSSKSSHKSSSFSNHSNNNVNNIDNNKTSKRFSTDLTRDKSWEIKVSDLQLLEELGSGQFGVVRHGKWKGKYDVAVKLMKEGTMSERDFIEEAKVMTKLQHPNLVKLHGICIEHRPICIVAEFMKHSSLLSFLRKNEQKILESSQRIRFLLNMCKQVASGMAYLESHNYIHRDLAARNCLVGHGNIVKVADFGLTRYVIDDEYTSSGGTKFPIRWAPPEVLWFTRFSSKSDVWAYGILTWEVFSLGKLPYGKLTNAEVVEKIREGHRLDKPKQWCPMEIFQIMQMCWQETPEKRPTFRRIEQCLIRLKESDLDNNNDINKNNENCINDGNNNNILSMVATTSTTTTAPKLIRKCSIETNGGTAMTIMNRKQF